MTQSWNSQNGMNDSVTSFVDILTVSIVLDGLSYITVVWQSTVSTNCGDAGGEISNAPASLLRVHIN